MPTDTPHNPSGSCGHPPSKVEGWVVFVLGALVVGLAGVAATSANAVSWGALAALSHAQDVLHQGEHINLGYIGFVEPPLPTLLYIPIAAILPTLVKTGAAVCIFGAIVAGLTLRALNAAGADLGLGRPVRWGLCALFLLNPVYLGLAATGAPDALYVYLMLAAGWRLLRWQRGHVLRDLMGCSIFLALALVTRYDALIPLCVATLVVAVETLRQGGKWAALEGTVLTFLLPGVYIGGLWVLANWIIMGDALHFWRIAWEIGENSAWTVTPWSSVVASLVVFAPLAASAWWAVWGAACGRPRLALWPAVVMLSPCLAVLVVPSVFDVWLDRAATTSLPLAPIPDLFAPMLAAGALLSACALADLLPLFGRKHISKEICLAGAAALLAVNCLAVMGPEERVYIDPRPAIHGHAFGADDASGTKRVAERVSQGPADELLVIAGWPGYAVTLYSGRAENKVLLVDMYPPDDPLEEGAVGSLLVRGETLLSVPAIHERWEAALGTELADDPAWANDGWACYLPER